ncbi:putative glycolipid-binding domain-containing protein [Umezawaea beigongshangensis]|uniref:putative glycolipid-binding domain-containing protein n=1 Tax=Umezawaea beigongshangensis TaxID=2780383 RepID=UPI0018F24717|nr:putative glycolipid-binding domain-containing protein [Umezawaea beigongshangensis]
MNSSNSTERVVSSAESRSAPAPRRPEMLTWQGYDTPRLEQVRLLLSDRRLRASGRLVAAAGETESFSASFELSAGETGAVTRLLLRTATVEEERQISLSRTEDGAWLVDLGQGVERTDFEGAVDVDVQFVSLFNAIPIRRLGLHREASEHDLPVVRVSLPDLTVRVVRQKYRTVSVGAEESVVNFSSEDFSQDITVDSRGLVLDYPRIARRI